MGAKLRPPFDLKASNTAWPAEWETVDRRVKRQLTKTKCYNYQLDARDSLSFAVSAGSICINRS